MIKKFKNRYIEFDFANKKNKNTISPLLEIFRGKVYVYILKNFIIDSLKNFNVEIFSFKKSHTRTLTNLLSSWLFDLYSNYDFKNDPFLPSNYEDTKILEQIFKDYSKNKFDNIDNRIKNIITNLKNNYKKGLEKLNEYKESNLFIKNYRKYKIKKTLIENEDFNYYKLDIELLFIIKEYKLNNILNNIIIPVKVYNRCKEKYTGLINYFDTNLWIILFRYQLLGSNNHQLAVLPNVLNLMFHDFQLNFECFASSINSIFKNYCSLYYDIEKYFGSKGNFFNLKPISGTFSFNPPYQSKLIVKGINTLFKHLDEAKKNKKKLNFIITIPIWDIHGKNKMNELNNETNTTNQIDYGEFGIIQKIKTSKFFKGLRMISKKDFTYLDHNYQLFKDVTIQNTYIIVLSSDEKNNFIEKITNYNFKKNKEIEV